MKFCTGSLTEMKGHYDWLRTKCRGLSNLETFWNRRGVLGAVQDLTDFWLCVDSGAFSFYRKYVLPEGSRYIKQDYDYLKSKNFKEYLEGYITWLHKNKDKVGVYVTLDVIGSAEKTWEVLKYIESCGLKPLPVYHYGDDVSWLDKYIDNYEYIGVGGVATFSDSRAFFDSVFRRIGLDERGQIKRKVHGFACTDYKTVVRYPFFSVDSVSWIMGAAYGGALFPQKGLDSAVFCQPALVKCSKVASKAKISTYILEYEATVGKEWLQEYLTEVGVWDEQKSVMDIVDDVWVRRKLNLYYYKKLAEELERVEVWDVFSSKQQRKFII